MNTYNNKRKRTSQEKIEKIFLDLIETKEITEITVSQICQLASMNRSTFYANYIDIYDLADKIKENLYHNLLQLYQEESIKKAHSYDYLKLFCHIKENQTYYKIMFKLNFDFLDYYDIHLEEDDAMKYLGTTNHIDYHIEYFKAGFHAIVKKWL